MIELKGCAADAACAVPGESHCLGNAVWYQVSTIESLTLLGGSEALCLSMRSGSSTIRMHSQSSTSSDMVISSLQFAGRYDFDLFLLAEPLQAKLCVKHYFPQQPLQTEKQYLKLLLAFSF
ncbi:hypothetical protein DPMN_142123 [Dreissena polymorpha]|uniref:Uncharacterized protein n=1 Tax=Dreissena polymorpha TaxID=45954 RepID=A0A9D4GDZ6_DREPO|nr:hypothetical protein DPMN_142123 [Dreissena polymorpha]